VIDRDLAMDAYAHALGALREDNFRRLRAYVAEPNSKFTSWLVVVVRRLVRDYLRHRYGRSRSSRRENQDEQQTRRRLEDLVVERVDPDELEASAEGSPDAALRRRDLLAAVRRAIDELEPTDRLLLALRFEDERPAKEIARLLRLPTVFQVYRRLGHALDRVRQALARSGVEDAEP
jgi:RNA polymerase sigma factor (sigma-70 family)